MLKYNSNKLKTIGVIGGFGPQASAIFLKLIFDKFSNLGASSTQDFPRVVFENVQTAGVFNGNEDGFVDKKKTTNDVINAISRVERSGADFITIPCNSIFGIYDKLSKSTNLNLLHIANPIIDLLKAKKIKSSLVLGTTTTSLEKNDVYHTKLKKEQIKGVFPNNEEQRRIDSIIVNVFKNQLKEEDKKYLIKLIERYAEKDKVESVILACTEIPLILKEDDVRIPIFNSLDIYAEYTVSYCQEGSFIGTGNFYEESNIQHKFSDETKQPDSLKEFFKEESKYLVKNIPLKSIVLDVGCGWGRHLDLISNKISNGVGIDIDKKRIEESKEFLKNKNNIKTFSADIYDIPFPEGYFDVVICMNNTLGNLSKHKLAIKEMTRVLKNKGKLFISVHSNNMVEDKIEWYKKLGLKNPIYNNQFISSEEGFFSYCFSEEDLRTIFNKFDVKYEIKRLTPKSFIGVIEK